MREQYMPSNLTLVKRIQDRINYVIETDDVEIATRRIIDSICQ